MLARQSRNVFAALLERAAIVLAGGSVKDRLMWGLRDALTRKFAKMSEKLTLTEYKLLDFHVYTAQDLIDAVDNAASSRFKVLQEDGSYQVIEVFTQQALTKLTPQGDSGQYMWCVGRPDQTHYESYMKRGSNVRWIVFISRADPTKRCLAYVLGDKIEEVKDQQDDELKADNEFVPVIRAFAAANGLSWVGHRQSIFAIDLVKIFFRGDTSEIAIDKPFMDYQPHGAITQEMLEQASLKGLEDLLGAGGRWSAIHSAKAVDGDVVFLSFNMARSIENWIEHFAESKNLSISGDVHSEMITRVYRAWQGKTLPYNEFRTIAGHTEDRMMLTHDTLLRKAYADHIPYARRIVACEIAYGYFVASNEDWADDTILTFCTRKG